MQTHWIPDIASRFRDDEQSHSILEFLCRCGLVAVLMLALGGCEKAMHNMYDQPRYKPLTPSPLFANGNSSRHPVAGTVPRSGGSFAGSSSGRRGLIPAVPPAGPVTPIGPDGRSLARGDSVQGKTYSNPLPITQALLERGRQRFDIYCAPCHSRLGDGHGMIARRGFPNPPSYHSERLRRAPDSHFYQVITHGYGLMYSYTDRVAPHDRWAIVAYIRALQLSQHAPVGELTQADIARLKYAVRARVGKQEHGRQDKRPRR